MLEHIVLFLGGINTAGTNEPMKPRRANRSRGEEEEKTTVTL